MASLVGTLGVRVEVFERAAEFFNALDATAAACLITELHLPDMSGLEVQKRLVERGADLPVIILASEADVPTAVSAMSSGVLDFIEKPFVNRALLERIRQVLRSKARGEPWGCQACHMIAVCRRHEGSDNGRQRDDIPEDSMPG
jgi:FixJ family two-component response regulator